MNSSGSGAMMGQQPAAVEAKSKSTITTTRTTAAAAAKASITHVRAVNLADFSRALPEGAVRSTKLDIEGAE